MSDLSRSRTVSVCIDAAPEAVYEFVSRIGNLPRWATAFCRSIEFAGGQWLVQTADGPVTIEFVARNPLGVLDHFVTLKSGKRICNPMRVVPNGSGSVVMFTLFQAADTDDERFAEDANLVAGDLQTLKRVLEAQDGKRAGTSPHVDAEAPLQRTTPQADDDRRRT